MGNGETTTTNSDSPKLLPLHFMHAIWKGTISFGLVSIPFANGNLNSQPLRLQGSRLTPMPYRNSGIDLANGVLDRSVAVGVFAQPWPTAHRSEEHTSELQSLRHL